MREVLTIEKNPKFGEVMNYEMLRQKALSFIQELGSDHWTDYNIHDPGITIMELLCYAITDLGYRTSFDIKDILASPYHEQYDPEKQAFFSAKKILTVNPFTISDYRKLLIDVPGIKNAWLEPVLSEYDGKEKIPDDAAVLLLHADCSKSILSFEEGKDTKPVLIKGLYDVKVEFEDDEGFGNLNSGRMRANFSFLSGTNMKTAVLEMRMPSLSQLVTENEKYKKLLQSGSQLTEIEVSFIAPNRAVMEDIRPDQLLKALRRTVYATVTIVVSGSPVKFDYIPLKIWFQEDTDRSAVTLDLIKDEIRNNTGAGIIPRYLNRIQSSLEVMDNAAGKLQAHRNLCEDYLRIQAIEVEDIGVCADLDVEIDVDIEKVVAQAYYVIDEYFSPAIQFFSLDQLLAEGKTPDDIFDGPVLQNGFIDNRQLEQTNLKKTLYASDVINLLMEIKGVKAVRNLSLVRYDSNGNIKETAAWSMKVLTNRQPRLYIDGSKFLVFKNSLSFLPNRMELLDTLLMIRGQNIRPKFTVADNDLPIPGGNFYVWNDYQPLQYSLPLTYGVGYDGLPHTATTERKAQARQLKGYLLVFEQMLVQYLEQLNHVRDIFSVDEAVLQTYFSRMLRNGDIEGIEGLYASSVELIQKALNEQQGLFLDRRNRFLDHLMARFAENFNEYALMLYLHFNNKAKTDTQLILDKIAFIRDYPAMSCNRGRSFNYAVPAMVFEKGNVAGLSIKLKRLLDFRNIVNYFELYEEKDQDGVTYERRWRLRNNKDQILLSSSTRYVNMDLLEAEALAMEEIRQVRKFIRLKKNYKVLKAKNEAGFYFNLVDDTGEVIATRRQVFKSKTLADSAIKEVIDFDLQVEEGEKIHIVEHLLLRPHRKKTATYDGDPMLSICVPEGCDCCGEEDPYSFRMSIIINGEGGLANSSMEFRRFAERTIRLEVPAHLGVKICWVSTEDMQSFEGVYHAWLLALARPAASVAARNALSDKLRDLLIIFESMKSVYPEARLHDCVDGDDTNRVYLNQTIVTSNKNK